MSTLKRILGTLFFLWTSDVLATDQTDLIEDISAPVPSSAHTSAHEIRLKSLQNFIFTQGEKQETLAVAVYPLSSQKNDLAWDDLDVFAQNFDRKFFKGLSKKVVAGSLLCAAVGAVAPHPSCGYVLYSVGNFLKVPISSVESNALITWITITTTPAFADQSFHIGRRILSYIFGEESFAPTSSCPQASEPHVLKKRGLHYIAKAALFGSAAISGAVPAILMRNAERDFPMFVAFTGIPFYLAWVENYYRVGSLHIDHMFRRYGYAPRTNEQKRKILKQKIVLLKDALRQDDTLVKNAYTVFCAQQEKGFVATEGTPFAFSILFLRNLNRMTVQAEQDEEAQALLLNFKADVDATAPRSFLNSLFDWSSVFVTGAGTYTRYCITQSVLSDLLKEMGASPETALYVSASLSAFESVYRVSTSHYVQQHYFRSFGRLLRATDNLTVLRKGAGLASFMNGSLFALPNLVAGLRVFEGMTLPTQVAWLAPSFLLDLSYYDAFFNRHYQDTLTHLSTLRTKEVGVIGQRAHLMRYANKAFHDIDHFDVETVETLYKIIQKGV